MATARIVYQHNGITLWCGDCREVVPRLAFDWIATDPPYGIGHPTDYATRGRAALASCRDYAPVAGDGEPFDPAWLLALGKPLVCWGANYYADRLPPASGWLIWDKDRPDDLDQATVELAWTNFVKGARRFRHRWHGMLRASNDPIFHPTQKPKALWDWVMRLRWAPPGIALDPYAGSGSLLWAARANGREAIGVELVESYAEKCAAELRAMDLQVGLFAQEMGT